MPKEDGAERFHVSDSLALLAKKLEAQTDEEAVVRPRTEIERTIGVEHEAFVEVEWTGQKSLITNPVVAFKLALEGQPKGFTHHQAAVVRAANRIRRGAFPKVSRTVGPRTGFSRTYSWGHKNKTYIQRMTAADALKLKESPDGKEFRILGQDPEPSPLILPDFDIRVVSDRELRRVEGYIADDRPRPRR